jgi:hypothetical protein
VFKDGDRFFYRPNLSGPDGGTTFGSPIEFRGTELPAISKETSDTTSFGGEAYPTPATVMLNYSSTFTTSDVYFADVNGDGITDLVSGGTVLFGFVDADGITNFSPASGDTPVPIDAGVVDAADLLDDFGPIFEARVDQNPLLDAVRRWVAPFDGQIRITGAVALQDTSAAQLAENYQTADGVRVAIQRNGTELWSLTIAATDHDPHAPTGVDAVNVQRGDRIYFRVQSVFDGKYDQVDWIPHVQYNGVVAPADVNGLNPYVFDAAADFTLGGRASQVQVPFDGTVRIQGGLSKNGVTTDNVTLRISKNTTCDRLAVDELGPDRDHSPGRRNQRRGAGHVRRCRRDQSMQRRVTKRDAVRQLWRMPRRRSGLFVRIDSPIDLSLIEWVPRLFSYGLA